MLEIYNDTYRGLAKQLRDAIGTSDYFNGSVELSTEEFCARLTTTLIVYRRDETTPEGHRRPFENVVPVWWELTTTRSGVPTPNDFSFSELKPYMIDYD